MKKSHTCYAAPANPRTLNLYESILIPGEKDEKLLRIIVYQSYGYDSHNSLYIHVYSGNMCACLLLCSIRRLPCSPRLITLLSALVR